jgi:hypothetical protein
MGLPAHVGCICLQKEGSHEPGEKISRDSAVELPN